jgi:glycosyltransferase involved in cell wall biosynthesis
VELTILMPCLNEALTVESCVHKAQSYLQRRAITGEVLLADNGSTDGSQSLAQAAGARVIQVARRGYGAALIGGLAAARGRYVIMADADDSYDFTKLDDFVDQLRCGSQVVVGNRFTGQIMPGAMPVLNRYVGNPVLSFLGRRLFGSPVGDFHCGLRGCDRNAILQLKLRSEGMEFASEMIVKASLARLKITEVPITLSRDGRQRPPHLRRWRDGWRHLRFMLLRSPQWLFLYPGLLLCAFGLIGAIVLVKAPLPVAGLLTLDINALLYFSIAATVGVQVTYFGLFAMAFARKMELQVSRGFPEYLLRLASRESAIAAGAVMVLAGAAGALFAILKWRHISFGPLVPSDMMRITIPSVTTLAIGAQIAFGGFMLGFIEID